MERVDSTQSQFALDLALVEELRASVQGEVIMPGDAGYFTARTVWNAMVDKYPAVIMCCVAAEDVATAIRFARTHNREVAVRGGGHNVAGKSVCEGGLMIDLSHEGHPH